MISTSDAQAVLWYFGAEGGLEPGGFTGSLMRAIARADSANARRLRRGFPGLVTAVKMCQEDPNGLVRLQDLVRRRKELEGADQRHSWTQPICLGCFDEINPGRTPVRAVDPRDPFEDLVETCAYCGRRTIEQIFVREDPRNVLFPHKKE